MPIRMFMRSGRSFDAGEQRPAALISPDEMVVIISSIRSISVSSRRELAPACEFFWSHFHCIGTIRPLVIDKIQSNRNRFWPQLELAVSAAL